MSRPAVGSATGGPRQAARAVAIAKQRARRADVQGWRRWLLAAIVVAGLSGCSSGTESMSPLSLPQLGFLASETSNHQIRQAEGGFPRTINGGHSSAPQRQATAGRSVGGAPMGAAVNQLVRDRGRTAHTVLPSVCGVTPPRPERPWPRLPSCWLGCKQRWTGLNLDWPPRRRVSAPICLPACLQTKPDLSAEVN